MDLEQLQEIAEKDLKINDTELDLESLKTPQIHNKYLKHLTKFKLLLTRAQDDFTKVKRDKWEYYTGNLETVVDFLDRTITVYQLKPFNLKILKQDVDKYIESDEEWIKANQKVKYLETIVDFLDRTLRQISNRTFTIKNAIDWRKFTSGAI